jgi:hypothetical protein
MGLGKRNYAGEAAKRQAILEGRLRPRRAIAAGGSGLHQVSDVYASTQRMRRDRLPNESKGKGEHFGKTLTHSQVVQPTNATAANRPRVDFGRTRDLSSMGGNPANINHRPFNRQRGTTAQSWQGRKEEMLSAGAQSKAEQYIKS